MAEKSWDELIQEGWESVFRGGRFWRRLLPPKCTCPAVCDCQYPPPDDWDGKSGCWQISNECPVHNDNPTVAAGCPVHGGRE